MSEPSSTASPSLGSSFLVWRRGSVEPTEPLGNEREAVLVERVDAGAAAFVLPDQAGVFEDAQVSRRGGPLVLEPLRNFARSGDAAAEVKRK